MSAKEVSSHGEALKSSSIIGGSTAIVMLIRMVRTKAMALLLGPAGVGLEAIYDSVIGFSRAAADLGISSSGVRQIAGAVGTDDAQTIAKTVVVLRRTCLILASLGALTIFLAREPISRMAFGHTDHAFDIGLLSLVLLFGGIMGGQGALLQGMRRINELAMMNILGAVLGLALSVPIVYIWGASGIAVYLVIAAAAGAMVAWYYSRNIKVVAVEVTARDVVQEVGQLLKLGLVFLASGLMTAGALFVIRVFVTRVSGMDGAGQFQAANALAFVYVGFVLQAMGTDFYPRLTAVAGNNERCNQMVNEQAEVSILLALPGVLATLACAPWVIRFFYSDGFGQAAEILCWQVTGMLLRVVSWPMGYIVLAKGRAAAVFWTELAAYSVYTGLAWVGLKIFGLPGVGMAFCGLYLFHCVMMNLVTRRVSGFRWTSHARKLVLAASGVTAVTFALRTILPEPWATGIGCLISVIAGVICLRILTRLVGIDRTHRFLERFRVPDPIKRIFGSHPEVASPYR